MPVKRRKRKTIDDYPKPWEHHPVSQDRCERHRERMLASTRAGRRPLEWWACVFHGIVSRDSTRS